MLTGYSLVLLKDLDLNDTGLGDDDILKLRPLVNLEELELCRTTVTDQGMEYLTGFSEPPTNASE